MKIKTILIWIVAFLCFNGPLWAQAPSLPPYVYQSTDCSFLTWFGALCHDTDDGKLYKWSGSALEETFSITTITGQTGDTSPTSDDKIVTANDPEGTPALRSVTLGDAIKKAHGLTGDGYLISLSGTTLTAINSLSGITIGGFTAGHVPVINSSGNLVGAPPISVNSASGTVDITADQARAGTFFLNTYNGTTTFNLPSASAGMMVCVKNGQGNNNILRIDTDGSDYIVKSNGSRTSAAGDYYQATASPSNQICLVAFNDTDWYVTSEVGTWQEE